MIISVEGKLARHGGGEKNLRGGVTRKNPLDGVKDDTQGMREVGARGKRRKLQLAENQV